MAANGFGCVMSALTRLGEALRYLWPFNDPFEDGVKHATSHKVIFVDPKKLSDPDMAKNIAVLRDSIERQFPGFSRGESDDILKAFIERACKEGPYTQKIEVGGAIVGVVIKPTSALDHINKIIPFETGISLENMRKIPGDNYIWQKFFGVHEGAHVNGIPIVPPYDTDEKRLEALQSEINSDRAGIKFLRSLGREDMVQTWKDIRALGGSFHATSVFLGDNAPVEATQAHLDAARQFKNEMHGIVARELGIDHMEAMRFFLNDQEKYINAVDRAMERGSIGSTPEVTAYIRDYAGAYRRQVLEAHLDPHVPRGNNEKAPPQSENPAEKSEPSGHVHMHHSDAGSHMQINDKPATGYFNAQAAGVPEQKPVLEVGAAPAAKSAPLPA